ncbi:MAG: MATE family efflux transporter [Gammaproteobacteria bacterium]|nr:MATE family efflux transporter [Gammaproteobacteria bacterium]
MTSSRQPLHRRIRREILALLGLGLPLMGAQLAQMLLGFTDTVMAGYLSAADLAIVALGSAIWVPAMLGSLGVLMALSPTVAHQFGAHGSAGHASGDSLRQSLWIAALLALVMFLLLRNMAPLLRLAQVSDALIPGVDGYLDAISWGCPAITLFMALRFLNEGCGNARPVLVINLLSLPANLAANAVLMYGLLGFPALGAIGCGWASALVLGLQALLMIYYVRNSPRFRALGPIRLPSPDFPAIRALLALGLPIGASILLEAGLFAAVAISMGQFGQLPMAAHQIAANFTGMAFMLPLGLSGAIAVRVGQAAGAGNRVQARFRGFCGIALAGGMMSLSATLMLLAPGTITRLYTNDPAVIAIATSLLGLAALFQFSDGLQVAAAGALRGLKDTRVPMWLTLCAYWSLGFPVSYYFGLRLDYGPGGLWIGLISGLTAAAVMLNLRFYYISRPSGEPAQ